MRISTKGQVTIPVSMRERLGMLPNTEVSFILHEQGILIQRQQSTELNRGLKLLKHLAGKSTVRMSTDSIMKLTRS